MKVLCVGGGSGGHITPVVAIIVEIRKTMPDATICFITDKRFFSFAKNTMNPLSVSVTKVFAGKFRRYANLKWYEHIKHFFVSYLPNVVDVFKFCIGLTQSIWKILIFSPDIVFVKGGYVGLPVGLAAVLLKKPIVLHDSDAAPGLTNRILSKYAVKIGLGMPQETSYYNQDKVQYVGIPIDEKYGDINIKEKEVIRKKYIGDSGLSVVLAMGGSLGSKVINDEILRVFPEIKGKVELFLVTGKSHYDNIKKAIDGKKREYLGLRILPFISGSEAYDLIEMSDVVITRAGATTIAELAAAQKATIIIPSPYLSSDHQSKNAELLKASDASIVITQDNLKKDFLTSLEVLLSDKIKRERIGKNLHKFASRNAAEKMACLIIEEGKNAKT